MYSDVYSGDLFRLVTSECRPLKTIDRYKNRKNRYRFPEFREDVLILEFNNSMKYFNLWLRCYLRKLKKIPSLWVELLADTFVYAKVVSQYAFPPHCEFPWHISTSHISAMLSHPLQWTNRQRINRYKDKELMDMNLILGTTTLKNQHGNILTFHEIQLLT